MPAYGNIGNTAGMLRHRCTISTPTVTGQNTFGEETVSQIVIGTFPCFVDPTTGTELQAAQQRWAMAKYIVTMRHQPGLNFSGKEVFIWLNQNRRLDILNVNDPGENDPWITMIARDYDDTTVV